MTGSATCTIPRPGKTLGADLFAKMSQRCLEIILTGFLCGAIIRKNGIIYTSKMNIDSFRRRMYNENDEFNEEVRNA